MEDVDIAFCPHCGNMAPQKLLSHSISLHNSEGARNYFFLQCLTCNEALLYLDIDPLNSLPQISHGRFKLDQYKLVWPRPSNLHDSVPEKVQRAYKEAYIIKNKAPNAFANQIRRALEALCQDRGATKHTLGQNLKDLADRGEIPPKLAGMTEIIRKLVNIGSHIGEEGVNPEYVDVIDGFFLAIIEYVYIAPYKIAKFTSHLDENQKSQSL